MFRFRNVLPLIGAALVWATLLGTPTPAHALFSLTISDGTNNVTVYDNNNNPSGTGSDLAQQAGKIIYDGSIGGLDTSISTRTSNAPGTPYLAQLTINTSITTAGFTGTKTLTFTLQDTGFTLPTGYPLASMVSQLSTTQLPANTGVTYQSFLDTYTGTPLLLNTFGGTAGADPVSLMSVPFTLKSVTTLTITGTGDTETVQFIGLTAVAAPEPSRVAMALTAVPVLGLGYWLRRRKQA